MFLLFQASLHIDRQVRKIDIKQVITQMELQLR